MNISLLGVPVKSYEQSPLYISHTVMQAFMVPTQTNLFDSHVDVCVCVCVRAKSWIMVSKLCQWRTDALQAWDHLQPSWRIVTGRHCLKFWGCHPHRHLPWNQSHMHCHWLPALLGHRTITGYLHRRGTEQSLVICIIWAQNYHWLSGHNH